MQDEPLSESLLIDAINAIVWHRWPTMQAESGNVMPFSHRQQYCLAYWFGGDFPVILHDAEARLMLTPVMEISVHKAPPCFLSEIVTEYTKSGSSSRRSRNVLLLLPPEIGWRINLMSAQQLYGPTTSWVFKVRQVARSGTQRVRQGINRILFVVRASLCELDFGITSQLYF